MRLKEYLKERKKTDKDFGDKENILHMVMGLVTEIEEVISCQAYEVTDETGDLAWYLYKPLSMNKEILSTNARFNKILDIEVIYNIRTLKMKCLDSYKKIRFQGHDLEAKRKDGHTHLEIFMMLMHFCFDTIERNSRTYGIPEEHIFKSNINKLRLRFNNGSFNKDLSMNRGDEIG